MTSVLTDAELIAAFGEPLSENALRAMQKAIAIAVKKLAAGVSVEPVAELGVATFHWLQDRPAAGGKLYTAAAIAAARAQENERCAKVCEAPHHYFNDCKTNSECATAIRALLGKEAK